MHSIFRNSLIITLIILCAGASLKQTGTSLNMERPRLVVGIVVDQMRHEYLYRYYEKYGEGGFKRLMDQGFMNKNTHYNYIPTFTGPGHASIYTGTVPATHGIIANSWYDRKRKKYIYCTEDSIVSAIGGTESGGNVSPRNMLSTTITDELRLSNNMRSKVISISIKDRGAILPAGHTANAAYWYAPSTGHFISSTYYMEKLPGWADTFNKQQLADKYLNETWNTLLPIKEYTQSGKDDSPYEAILQGKGKPVFPYNLSELRQANGNFGLLPSTPFGNSITKDMAMAAIKGEKLGADEFTDFLAVSFSSTDYIGHGYGPNSVELEDTYLRLDKDIEGLLNFLDKEVGENNYLLFLTADHAVADVPQFMTDSKIPSGYLPITEIVNKANAYLNEKFGIGTWVEAVVNDQVYLNKKQLRENQASEENILNELANYLEDFNGISSAYTALEMKSRSFSDGIPALLQRGYNGKRSGDVLLVLEPGWIDQTTIATTHGSGYNYDTHVPLIWYGWKIKPGQSVKYHPVTDIAPTLSMMLNINFPSGSSGNPIGGLFE